MRVYPKAFRSIGPANQPLCRENLERTLASLPDKRDVGKQPRRAPVCMVHARVANDDNTRLHLTVLTYLIRDLIGPVVTGLVVDPPWTPPR